MPNVQFSMSNKTKMEKKKRKFDIEDRLIDFAILIADIVEALQNTKTANHIGGQMIRSGCSPALNYGEAQEAERL